MGFAKRLYNNFTSGLKVSDYIAPISSAIQKIKRKFGNLTIFYKGERFDSLSEYVRFKFLLDKQKAGIIEKLTRQVRFKINKKRVYIADFVYYTLKDNQMVVEDVKSPRLRYSSRFKEAQKGMRENFDLTIKIISPLRLYSWDE
jgi:hypothetical protein